MITLNRRSVIIWTANLILFFFLFYGIKFLFFQPTVKPISDTTQFLLRSQQIDGSFSDSVSFLKGPNKAIKSSASAQSVYALMRSYQHSKDDSLLSAVEHGLTFLKSNTLYGKHYDGGLVHHPKDKNIYPATTAYALTAAIWYRDATGNTSFNQTISDWQDALISIQLSNGSFPKILTKKSTDMGIVWSLLSMANLSELYQTLDRADRYYLAKQTPSLASYQLRVLAHHLRVKPNESDLTLSSKLVKRFLDNNRKNPLNNNCETLIGMVDILPFLTDVSQINTLKAELSKFMKPLSDFQVTEPYTVATDHMTYTFHGDYLRQARGGFMKDFNTLKAQVEPTRACLDFYISSSQSQL